MPPRIALLLHMHQPDYRDPDTGRPWMPWVRLHACRGYTDVAVLAAEAGAAPTINVVPSLLQQLAALRDGAMDEWERIARVPAEDLSAAERDFIRQRFVHGHPAMRRASPRYTALAARARELSDPADLRDLQVWSNLAWMGSVARRDPFIAELVAQDEGFSHRQLVRLLDHQRAMVGRVLELWRQFPSLSVSPLCHPILPLLVDVGHARRCLPDLPDDLLGAERFAWPDDARRQLVEARNVCEEILGRRPAGLWPSEGALSPEVMEIVDDLGFAWVATDEEMLRRSDRVGEVRIDGPWVIEGAEAGTRLLFRDHELSDRIGFLYHQWPGDAAVDDLLASAAHRHGDDAPIVPIVLDGENPWEAYPDAGEDFLRRLFASGAVVGMDVAARVPTRGRIRRLHTGSWIGADLRIWAGDADDWLAWSLLADARQAFEDAGRPEAAWPHLANAESSDWFWWLGPEFQTEVADLFDALFRAHVAAVWATLGLPVPLRLRQPVGREARPGPLRPAGVVHPTLDGRLHLSEWAGAAPLPLPRGGSMARAERRFFGGAVAAGDGMLWLRIDRPDGGREPDPIHRSLVIEQEGGPELVVADPWPGAVVSVGPRCVVIGIPTETTRPRLALRWAGPGGAEVRHPARGWLEVELPSPADAVATPRRPD
ncbi:MAG: hypothetical protein D6798_06665 [Deltaproteobacteria bacterium]|nr:MAG: hypothetical protein D6798_06665 [Deltaproteobacteria bacterium]